MVTKNRRLLVSGDEKLERLMLAHTPRFLALLDAVHDRIKKSRGVKHEDFWKQQERRIGESRAETIRGSGEGSPPL